MDDKSFVDLLIISGGLDRLLLRPHWGSSSSIMYTS